MNDYTPIDCSYYDKIEVAIIRKQEVELVYADDSGSNTSIQTKLVDTVAISGEEFIILPTGLRIRMDKIVSINGDTAPRQQSC